MNHVTVIYQAFYQLDREFHAKRVGDSRACVKSDTLEPGSHFFTYQFVSRSMRCVATLVGVRHLLATPVPKQKDLAAGGGIHRKDVIEMMLLHHEDQICLAGMRGVDLPGTVRIHGDVEASHELKRCIIGRMIDECANPGRSDLDARAATAVQAMTDQELGNGAAADVSGTNGEYGIEHGKQSM